MKNFIPAGREISNLLLIDEAVAKAVWGEEPMVEATVASDGKVVLDRSWRELRGISAVRQEAEVALKAALASGRLSGFVYSPARNLYLRIPVSYWPLHWPFDALLKVKGDETGLDPSTQEQPLVMEAADLGAWEKVVAHLRPAQGSDGTAPSHGQPRLAVVGRRKGDETYPEDAEIVRRVIALCDDENIMVSKALNRLVSEISPVDQGDDTSKKRRIRGKVQAVRPDLTRRN